MALSKVGKNQVDQSASLTVDGDLTVDTNTLYVDSANNRVGIGISPSYALHTSTSSGVNRFESTAATGEAVIHTFNRDGQTAYIGKENSVGSYTFSSGGVADAFAIAHYGSAAPIQIGHNTPELIIDSSGRVTMPYQPSFRSRGSNGAYIQTTPIPFPTVLHNIGSHYNSSTYTFTAPIAGRYLFHVNLGITNGSTNAYAFPTLNVNGVGQFYTYFQIASTWYGNNHLTAILDLSVNDYVNVSFSGTATYFNGGSECQFSGHLLG